MSWIKMNVITSDHVECESRYNFQGCIQMIVRIPGFGESSYTIEEGVTTDELVYAYECWIHSVTQWVIGIIYAGNSCIEIEKHVSHVVFSRINECIGKATMASFIPDYQYN